MKKYKCCQIIPFGDKNCINFNGTYKTVNLHNDTINEKFFIEYCMSVPEEKRCHLKHIEFENCDDDDIITTSGDTKGNPVLLGCKIIPIIKNGYCTNCSNKMDSDDNVYYCDKCEIIYCNKCMGREDKGELIYTEGEYYCNKCIRFILQS
jgi:hypothetical protein